MKPFDIDAAKKAIISEGIPYLDAADNFLKKYGGRYIIKYEERGFGTSLPSKIVSVELAHFNATLAVERIDSQWFTYYLEQLGKPVTPIGECGQGHATLMIDADGIIYGGFDECFGKIANSPEEAILELCDRTQGQWESIPLKESNE